MKKFKKDDNILFEGSACQCVVADEETAVFGYIIIKEEGNISVSYKKLFAVSNRENEDFNCVFIDIKK